MKLSLQWLRDFVDFKDAPKETGLKLTLATAEIEGHEQKGEDTLYDIDNKSLTHRPDLWGHYGFAREVAAIYKVPLKPLPLLDLPEPSSPFPLEVQVKTEPSLCPRYNALVIDGVQVGPSPEWLVKRLEAVGARSINNIVDLTNYVLFEVGQPLHAFDQRLIRGQQIIVRHAEAGESITTLDGGQHTLNPEMVVIADAEGATAVAGVMGGGESEVSADTTCIVLESANFHPTNIRLTAAKLGIRTESSMRFEKGLDPQQTELGVRRFWTLLKEICPSAQVISQLYDLKAPNPAAIEINTQFSFINRKLGTDLAQEEIADILTRLCFSVQIDGDALKVTVPSFRATGDVSIPEDLVEEVGRIYGYDNITPIAPLTPVEPVRRTPLHQLQVDLRTLLSGPLGYSEVYNYAFVGDKILEQAGQNALGLLTLQNYLSVEHRYMRSSLVPNMLKITAENLRHYKNFALYELDRVFHSEATTQSDFAHEKFELCALRCRAEQAQADATLFYQLKGEVESLLQRLPYQGQASFHPPQAVDSLPPWCHPGRTALIQMNQQEVGYLTQLHPKIASQFEIKGQVGFFILSLEQLLKLPTQSYDFAGVQKYPTVPFDISLICPERTLIAEVEACMLAVNPERIQKIKLFDIYQGENIGPGKKSLAFTLTFAAPDHTLSPEEIETLQNGVIEALEQQGYVVRKG